MNLALAQKGRASGQLQLCRMAKILLVAFDALLL